MDKTRTTTAAGRIMAALQPEPGKFTNL